MTKNFSVNPKLLESFRLIVIQEPYLGASDEQYAAMGCSGCSGSCYFACQNDCKHDCSGDCGMTCIGGSRDNDGW